MRYSEPYAMLDRTWILEMHKSIANDPCGTEGLFCNLMSKISVDHLVY